MMNTEKVRFGIIGIGNMGSVHVRHIEELHNTELVAVCDINPAAFDRIAPDTRKHIRCYTAAEEICSDPEVEALIIAVPHYFHPDLAILAMEHGKHVIVEKPIAVHKAEAERLIRESEKHPELVRSLMFNQRTMPAHRRLKQLIGSGELGRIRRINWTITDWFRSQPYYDSGDWRASWSGEGGGVLLNQCPHQLDLMQWFFGMPVRVRAAVSLGKYHEIEVEDEVNAYLEYADGMVGNFITTTGEAPGTNRLEIACERGRVILEKNKITFNRNEVETSVYSRTASADFGSPPYWECDIPFDPEPRPPHRIVIENVAEAIRNGAGLIAPMAEGIRSLELGNAILLSGLKDKTVTLPMDAAEYAELLDSLVKNSKPRIPRQARKSSSAGFEKSF